MLVSSEPKATSERIMKVHVTPDVLHYKQGKGRSIPFFSDPDLKQ